MTIIFCIDESGGVAFNRRRQSRDSAVAADAIALVGTLKISEYSAPLFAGNSVETCDPLSETEGAVFLERTDAAPLLDRADTLVIYNWNRRYPADVRFTADPAACGFELCEETEFPGTSHEKITRQVWRRG